MNDLMPFTDLVDLASERLGGTALHASDEFFAEKDNLLRAHPAVFKEHEYTDRGKWMDGWESRRRREGREDPNAHDSCIIRLGLPGIIRGVVVDTSFFRGNFPESCSVEACEIRTCRDLPAILDPSQPWVELLPRSALRGDQKNPFPIRDERRFTHVRLNIFPDGGVARFRVHGEAVPDLDRLSKLGGPVDLAAVENGAWVVVCSDMFFGSRHNLIMPGRAANMSDGWETRRRRGPGHDWSIVRLGMPGIIRRAVIDTTHFRGNAPGEASLEACHAPGATADSLVGDAHAWRPLLRTTKIQPHTVHVFEEELRNIGLLTHVRINVFPDGGVARLRLIGDPIFNHPARAGIERANGMTSDEAIRALRACCSSSRWAQAMTDGRPYDDLAALLRAADRNWFGLAEKDWLEAFAGHPRIGETRQRDTTTSSQWSAEEQSRVKDADEEVKAALALANEAHAKKFGFIFIACASGKSGQELLALLKARLDNSRADELRTSMEEQAQITKLRLIKWINP
ncbi:MAG: allantoicase [Deltaproteobacteria bacterium]|nr:allantoicase [Deltaproteobacteria bacterium]